MTHLKITHPLDYGEHYLLYIDYDTDTHELTGSINDPLGSAKPVEQHLLKDMLVLKVNETQTLTLELPKAMPPYTFHTTLPVGKEAFNLDIVLGKREQDNGQKWGRIRIENDSIAAHEILQRLSVFETRMLGYETLHKHLPYTRADMEKPALRMDLHTHSSGQISAQGLIDVAFKNNRDDKVDIKNKICYPTRLLKELKIDCCDYATHKTPRFRFPPLDANKKIPHREDAALLCDLSEEDLAKLRAAMAIPPDQQVASGDFETVAYKFRYPISKHPAAAFDLWLKVAEEYKAQGIEYAEITAASTSFLTSENLAFIHDAMPRIEAATGVKLRFLAGIPRNLPENAMEREIDKLKIMGDSPYIVGVDFIGFEDNKTLDMKHYIDEIATWAVEENHDPDFTLRIHAGENRKNLANVKEALKLAKTHNMRLRIGHAVHGLDPTAISMAKELADKPNRMMIECNPVSNQALNNIDRIEELNIRDCVENKIPFGIFSDSSGLFQTTAQELSTIAGFAGIGTDGVKLLQETQDAHIAFEHERFERRQKALSEHFLDHIAHEYAKLEPLEPTPDSEALSEKFREELTRNKITVISENEFAKTFRKKHPITILGATGTENWNDIGKPQQQAVAAAINTLLEQLNPTKVYFLIGRPKDGGITKVLSDAIVKHNTGKPVEERFALVSATVQANQTSHSFTCGLTHVIPMDGTRYSIPHQLVTIVTQQKGHMIFVGGGTTTRDTILLAHKSGKFSFGLMHTEKGASVDKAQLLPQYEFEGSQGLIEQLHHDHNTWFKTQFQTPERAVRERR